MKLAKRPVSLAFRLSCWHAASSFLLLLTITTFLYFGLVRTFKREDNQYLAEKVRTLQTLLHKHPQQFDTVRWEVEGESLTRASIRVLSRVISPDGTIMIETNGMSRELHPDLFPQPSVSATPLPPSKEVRTLARNTFQVLSAMVPDHRGGTLGGYTVQVAINLAVEKRLLAGYRHKLWVLLGLGLVACVLIGHRIAYEGMRPIKDISVIIARTRSPDFGERVRQEGLPAELHDLAATFNELMDRLSDSFGRLSRFSADIAHELRTPVNNLLGELHVAMSKVRSPREYQDLLGSLSEECDQLKTLIDSLLFLARADHPAMEICREELYIEREVELVRDFYNAAATEAGVALTFSVPDGVHFPLDRMLLQRALGNLVQNALAHTSASGHVEILVERTGAGLFVSVRDDGVGIAANHLTRIVDRFYRVDSARAKDTGGVGLGLAIVQSIALLHGGTVEIISEVGKGTTVTLAFPNYTTSQPREFQGELSSS